jgi:hypothetical protein
VLPQFKTTPTPPPPSASHLLMSMHRLSARHDEEPNFAPAREQQGDGKTHLLASMQRSSVVSGCSISTLSSLKSSFLRDTFSQFIHLVFVTVQPTNTSSMRVVQFQSSRFDALPPLCPALRALGSPRRPLLPLGGEDFGVEWPPASVAAAGGDPAGGPLAAEALGLPSSSRWLSITLMFSERRFRRKLSSSWASWCIGEWKSGLECCTTRTRRRGAMLPDCLGCARIYRGGA